MKRITCTTTALAVALAAFTVLVAPTGVAAETLRIGVGTEATTMDPHFYNLGPNTEITESVYDRLIHHDENLKTIPGLAESWSVADDGVTLTSANVRMNFSKLDGLFSTFGSRSKVNSTSFTSKSLPS